MYKIPKIQQINDKKTVTRYFITLPKALVKRKNWEKGKEIFFVFNERGNIENLNLPMGQQKNTTVDRLEQNLNCFFNECDTYGNKVYGLKIVISSLENHKQKLKRSLNVSRNT